MLHKTRTDHAPRYLTPFNHKWFRDLAVSHIINHTLEGLDMKLPQPMVKIADVRRRYHEAEVRPKLRRLVLSGGFAL